MSEWARLEREMDTYLLRAALIGATGSLPIQWFCWHFNIAHPKSPHSLAIASSLFGLLHALIAIGWGIYFWRRAEA